MCWHFALLPSRSHELFSAETWRKYSSCRPPALEIRVDSPRVQEPRPAVAKPGLGWALCRLASGWGSCMRRQGSCCLLREVEVGVEAWEAMGFSWFLCCFHPQLQPLLLPLLRVAKHTCPIFTYMWIDELICPLLGLLALFPQTQKPRHFNYQLTNSMAVFQVD